MSHFSYMPQGMGVVHQELQTVAKTIPEVLVRFGSRLFKIIEDLFHLADDEMLRNIANLSILIATHSQFSDRIGPSSRRGYADQVTRFVGQFMFADQKKILKPRGSHAAPFR